MSALILVFAITTNANPALWHTPAPVPAAEPQSYFLGPGSGFMFQKDTVSHVFIGPYAGDFWRGDEKICPLFILNDSYGNQLITIDRNGRLHVWATKKKIRAAFRNYQMYRKVTDP